MADSTIDGLPTIGTVDRTVDKIPIWDASGSLTGEATINSALGFTGGNPVSTTDSQTLTNKTLTSPVINTPTLAVNDNAFTIRDNADTSKVVDFQLSGLTTATTRTLTIPDASTTLVGTGTTQTLTNKTLTSPTITNPTLTVDTISEFTVANGVTIDGLSIKDSALNTNNSVPNNAWNNTGAFGSSWAWTTWTPTRANITIGNGTETAKYIQIGKTVTFFYTFILGTTSAIGSTPTITMPVTPSASFLLADAGLVGTGTILDAATAIYACALVCSSGSSFSFKRFQASATDTTMQNITATTPITFATSDRIFITGSYEIA